LSWRSPERLSRTRRVWPDEAGMGRRHRAWRRRHRSGSDPDGTRHTAPRRRRSGPPSRREQLRAPGPDQGGASSGVLGDLGVQELDAASQGAQAGHGGSRLRSYVDPLAEPPAGADQARRGERTQSAAEAIGGGEDQGMQLALGVGGGLDRRTPGGQPHRQRRPVTAALGWARRSRPRASRAALVASSGSDLAPWRRAARRGRSSSTTCSA
jgi:hypothetical protein